MKTTLKKRLIDALNACHAIQSFIENRMFAEYERNQMLRSAVERQFEIMGEALNQAEVDSPELSTLIPDMRRTSESDYFCQALSCRGLFFRV